MMPCLMTVPKKLLMSITKIASDSSKVSNNYASIEARTLTFAASHLSINVVTQSSVCRPLIEILFFDRARRAARRRSLQR
ncbi:MAG: hypothetical protein ACI9DC_004447 [Gammaproteobacteria bacterium]|jgi:hypothetical protein